MTTSRTDPVPLAEAGDRRAFGGKAAQLALAARAGLPVPAGVALPWLLVDAVASGDADATAALETAASPYGPTLAVRSSALDEDSHVASFAGQHLSLLNVPASRLAEAVRAVLRSGHDEPALAYRRRLGLSGTVRVGIVVQEMVDADVAGVLFHPQPVTGADEVVIEAAWGLGEAVVGGLVAPDLFRLSKDGEVLERRLGVKDLEVRAIATGGTAERPVAAERARVLCLGDGQLGELHRLAVSCKAVFGGSQDLEWAFAGDRLWLLQRRAVTTATST